MQRYRSRISGPLLDRIDIHVEVPAVAFRDFAGTGTAESSAVIQQRVTTARRVQRQRFAKTRIYCNAQMTNRHIRKYCVPGPGAARLLETAIDRLGFSARAYSRILKVARTIADLEGSGNISEAHVAEGIQSRHLDRTAAA